MVTVRIRDLKLIGNVLNEAIAPGARMAQLDSLLHDELWADRSLFESLDAD